MDFNKIKNLVKQNGDKFIVIENGEPEIVLMSFKEYEKLAGNGSNRQKPEYEAPKLSEEYADLDPRGLEETELIVPAIAESIGLPVRLEDIRLEDLPI